MKEIFLCDDNKEDLDKYAKMISEFAKEKNINTQIFCFEKVDSLFIDILEFNRNADIIYINPSIDKGLELAKKIAEKANPAKIIFLANDYSFLYDAFKIGASQFFLKDEINEEKFKKTFYGLLDYSAQSKGDLFVCEFAGIKTVLQLKDIEYFEIMNRIIRASYKNDDANIKFYGSMEKLEGYLAPKFFLRIHRSYLINMLYIEKIGARKVVLKTGVELPVGNIYAVSARKTFDEYIEKNHVFYKV